MSINQQNKEEEVDLGSLFVIIGNGFKKFFQFIGKILTGIFHFFIQILLFIKENILKLGISAMVGAAFGGYLEIKSETIYGSDMILEPNFKSSKQLYSNINYYNELVGQEEFQQLETLFEIDSVLASSIVSFEITPLITNNDILESYDELITSVDTASVRNYTFRDFEQEFTDYDYKLHKIHVKAQNNKIFEKLGETIVSSIEENKYYNRLKILKKEDLYRSDSILRQNLRDVDSLRKVYNKVMLDEAKKQTTGTNIDLGGDRRETKELELFKVNRTVANELRVVSTDIAKKSEIVNVVSNFQPVGYKIAGITQNKIIIYGVLGFIFMISFLLLIKLNAYLEGYKKK